MTNAQVLVICGTILLTYKTTHEADAIVMYGSGLCCFIAALVLHFS